MRARKQADIQHTPFPPFQHTTQVHFPGATKLSIAFDEQTCTETNCDFIVFFADHSRQRRWGQGKYSGRDQWPGCGGRPPLEIPASGFVLSWMTDASNTDWGWRMTVTATLPGLDPRTAPLPVLERRLYHVTELLQEGPRHVLLCQPPVPPAAPAVNAVAAVGAGVEGWAASSPSSARQEDEEESISVEGGDTGFAHQDAAVASSPESMPPQFVGSNYDPRHDLKGQTGQALWGFAVSSYQATAARFAAHALLAVLARWQPERLSVAAVNGVFGSLDGLWQLIAAAHALDEEWGEGPGTRGEAPYRALLGKVCLSRAPSGDDDVAPALLHRAVAVLGSATAGEQDVELACWALERLAVGQQGALLCTGPTFAALRERLLASGFERRMHLLALASLLVQRAPDGVAKEAVGSLGDTLRQLLEAQHGKEEERATKSPYLQALVQSVILVDRALAAGTAATTSPPWLSDVLTAVEMLRDVSKGQLPLRLLGGEFLPRVCAGQSVVLQVRIAFVFCRGGAVAVYLLPSPSQFYPTTITNRVPTPSPMRASGASSASPARPPWRWRSTRPRSWGKRCVNKLG
jgi:hypothetical protein